MTTADHRRGLIDRLLGPGEPEVTCDECFELLAAIAQAVPSCLTDHQRQVLTALALEGVPVDVMAERLDTTRGALYKTLHDARRRLRAELEQMGLLG